MGWAHCGQDQDGRDIGYAIEATCDHPGCTAKIDRGLSYVCGDMHGGDIHGCGKYFCEEHIVHRRPQLCAACTAEYETNHPEPEED